MSQNRRSSFRVPENRLITEIVGDNPSCASIVDLSNTGIRTLKPVSSGLQGPKLIQMEIPIPEASDTIWATGEIIFESLAQNTVGAGIHFKDMARSDWRLLEELVAYRYFELQIENTRIHRIKQNLNAMPSSYFAPPPAKRSRPTVR